MWLLLLLAVIETSGQRVRRSASPGDAAIQTRGTPSSATAARRETGELARNGAVGSYLTIVGGRKQEPKNPHLRELSFPTDLH